MWILGHTFLTMIRQEPHYCAPHGLPHGLALCRTEEAEAEAEAEAEVEIQHAESGPTSQPTLTQICAPETTKM